MNDPVKINMPSDLGPVGIEIVAPNHVRLSIHLSPPRGPVFTFSTHKSHGRWQIASHKLWDAYLISVATRIHGDFINWARRHPHLFHMVSLLQKLKK